MSLINEALKKAQKLRTGDPAGTAASVPGSGMHVTKRGEPRSAQQLMLMAAGGVVLVVLSVVATFWFVNRAPASKPAPKPVIVKSADTSAPIPAIIPPVVATETLPAKSAPPPVAVEKPVTIATPAPSLKPAAISPPPTKVTEKQAPVASTPASPAPTPQPITPATISPLLENPPASPPTSSAPAPVATESAPVTTDPRVHAFVDAVKVMGIRSSGGDSRVLMNDRVFRVNDIVDRNLGVRLTKVEPDVLTFTDSNGAIYTKNF
jgi:cytoskeletal protein RodZ